MTYHVPQSQAVFRNNTLQVATTKEVYMNFKQSLFNRASLFVAALVLAGCASTAAGPQTVQVRLTGAEEVPPVQASGTGTGSVTVGDDMSVTATIRTQGVNGVAAHIHEAAVGQNGPIIVPMKKTGENDWSTDPGAKLTPSQFESYKAGRLYLNVHTAQNKGGELRGQIRPAGGRSGGSSY
jgi:hypothetical protein